MIISSLPDKCVGCSHLLTSFEEVHLGFLKYEIGMIFRCDCHDCHYKCGCVCADVYCVNKGVLVNGKD